MHCSVNLKNSTCFNANYDGLVSRDLLSMHRIYNGLPCSCLSRMRAVDEKIIITKIGLGLKKEQPKEVGLKLQLTIPLAI